LFYAVAGQSAVARAHITIMATTDLHGNIRPVDYYTDKFDNRGLAKAATIIKQARRENPNYCCWIQAIRFRDAARVLSQQAKQPAARSDDAGHELAPLRCDGGG